jgi:hypothetical protein
MERKNNIYWCLEYKTKIEGSELRDDDLLHFRWTASFDSLFLQYPAPGKLGITLLSCLSCPLRSPSLSPVGTRASWKTAHITYRRIPL